jgi:hypothetical protein
LLPAVSGRSGWSDQRGSSSSLLKKSNMQGISLDA